MMWLVLASAYSFAADPEPLADVFPTVGLSADALESLLVPALLGPPATVYDQSAHTSAPSNELERATEALLFGKEASRVAAPDALRCWARIAVRTSRQGRLPEHASNFVAEHCGLASAPWMGATFYNEGTTAETVAEGLRPLAQDLLHMDGVTSLAVALARDEELGLTYGIIASLQSPVAFEPFRREVTPGKVTYVPGTVLDKRRAYALYVNRPGPEVEEWPLTGEGRFDIEIPMPAEPGAWRVAMTEQQKNRFANDPFSLTLYAGVPLPTTYTALRGPPSPDGVQAEEAFVARVNVERQKYGMAPLVIVGDRIALRAQIAELPESPRAVFRAVTALMRADPLPGEPHGAWGGGIAWGFGPEEAASAAVEHPVTRSTLLDARYDRVLVGAVPRYSGWEVVSMPIEPVADAISVRDEARRLLEVRPGTATLLPAPRLQDSLDSIAAQIAAGTISTKKGLAAANALFKDGRVRGPGNLLVLIVPSGNKPGMDQFTLVSGAKYLAIGQASGVIGDSPVASTVLLLVNAASDLAQ